MLTVFSTLFCLRVLLAVHLPKPRQYLLRYAHDLPAVPRRAEGGAG